LPFQQHVCMSAKAAERPVSALSRSSVERLWASGYGPEADLRRGCTGVPLLPHSRPSEMVPIQKSRLTPKPKPVKSAPISCSAGLPILNPAFYPRDHCARPTSPAMISAREVRKSEISGITSRSVTPSEPAFCVEDSPRFCRRAGTSLRPGPSEDLARTLGCEE
jgi:hypothetical protein